MSFSSREIKIVYFFQISGLISGLLLFLSVLHFTLAQCASFLKIPINELIFFHYIWAMGLPAGLLIHFYFLQKEKWYSFIPLFVMGLVEIAFLVVNLLLIPREFTLDYLQTLMAILQGFVWLGLIRYAFSVRTFSSVLPSELEG